MKQFVARILFFIAGPVPNAEEYNAAAQLQGQVSFRNASVIGEGDRTELCDGVAGLVPKPYAGFPSAEEAIAAKTEARELALKATGDSLAPVAAAPSVGTQLPAASTEAPGEGQPLADAPAAAVAPTPAPASGNKKQTARTPWGS